MATSQHLSLRLTNDDIVRLRTTIGSDTHELSLDRDEFEQLFRHMLKLRAKLDLRDASQGFDRR
ncbi:MAG: hypothetical protein AAGB26_16895 [Planctomycetota bacterium]